MLRSFEGGERKLLRPRLFVYLALGARLGANTYSAGALLDPPLTVIRQDVARIGNVSVFDCKPFGSARM